MPKVYFSFGRNTGNEFGKDNKKFPHNGDQLKSRRFRDDIPNPHDMVDTPLENQFLSL